MSEKLRQLIEILATREDELSQFQQGLVQLAVEPANTELRHQLAEGLLDLARVVEAAELSDISAALRRAADRLQGGDSDAANQVLRLVDALAGARSGKGLGALEPALEGESGAAQAGPEPLTDSYAEVDTSDLEAFCAESRENLQAAESGILQMEETGDLEHVDEVFRGIHSIKGGAQYLGLLATATLAHSLETLLGRIRAGRLEPRGDVTAVLLRAVDALSALIEGAAQQHAPSVDVASLVARLEAWTERGETETAAPAAEAGPEQATEGEREVEPGAADAAEAGPPEASGADEDAAAAAPERATEPGTGPGQEETRRAGEQAPEVEAGGPEAPSPDPEPSGVPSAEQDEAVSANPGSPDDLDMFAQEYQQHMDSLKRIVADFDGLAGHEDHRSTLRRDLHSIKGIAGFVGVPRMELLAGALELMVTRVLGERGDVPHDMRRAVSSSIELMDGIFEQFSTRQPITIEVAGQLELIEELTEREARGARWRPDPQAVEAASSHADHPLAALFLDLTRAVQAGEDGAARDALASLEEAAELHGFDELAASAAHLAAVYGELGPPVLAGELSRLTRLLPEDFGILTASRPPADTREAFEDLLCGVPGIARDLVQRLLSQGFDSAEAFKRAGMPELLAVPGMALDQARRLLHRFGAAAVPPRDAAASAPAAPADYETQIVADDYDRELVEIYLSNTLKRIDSVLGCCQRGEASEAAELLDDLTAAAGYMGYSPLKETFGRARHGLDNGDGTAGTRAILEPVRAGLKRVQGQVSGRIAISRPDALGASPGRSTAPAEPPPAGRRPGTAEPGRPAAGEPASAASGTATLQEPPPRAVAEPGQTRDEKAVPPIRQDDRQRELVPVDEAPIDPGRALVEAQTTLRVDSAKIDDLMNRVAELVVNRSGFMMLASTVRSVITSLIESDRLTKFEIRDLRNVVNRYDETTTDLGRVSNQLQEGVMKIRMVPVKTLFSRVPRVVRDLALREGREVRLAFSGEETELDKTVIEQLSDPILHLIRNAVSHGIEAPEERLAAGKPPEGRLRIAARHEGNMVIIEVEDDGRGLDQETIRKRLVLAGLMDASEVGRLSERELLGAIFLPGFSTARQVTDVSGRGVGLDVVKGNLEGIGGSVDVFTEPGRFCRFAIRIPLTMAIMQALLVKAGDEIFSIPVAAVIQAVKVDVSDVSTVEGQQVISVRGKVLPLVHVADVFNYTYQAATGQLAAPREANEGDTIQVVVMQGEGREIGIVVDGLLGSQDIVIKGLEDELVDARGVAGAAILGDGSVTLILDVAELQKMALESEHLAHKAFGAEVERFDPHVLERGGGELSTPPN